MLHQKLSMTPLEAVAKMAKNAVQSARESKTVQNGSYAWENADGTKTLVGVISGTDDTDTQRGFVQWVGDTEAPGTPTGVTARCSGGGTLIVSWDGTLNGGVPSDFDHISIVVDGTSRGRLVKAGSLAISGLSVGTHSVSAVAYDAARLDDGSLAPNASTASTAFSVEITNESAEAKTLAQQAEAVATATGQHFWSDSDGIHVTEVTEEEWQVTPSGANVLINSAGQLFRSVLNNLLAVLPTGIAIYDGNGNAAGNILAQFTASIIRLGGKFAASGRSTAKVQFFEDDSALTDLTAEHYLNTTTDPQVSHDLALSSTITDDELPDGTSRTVTGNVEVWEQVYHSGSTYSDEVMASLNGMTTNSQNNVSMGVQAIESSGASSQRVAFVTADTVRLTSGTGSQSVTSDYTMPQVRQALNCRSNSLGWVNSDTYANTNRAISVGARVNNSSSSVNGHDISLYLGPAGFNLYDATAARTLWNFGIVNTHFAVWPGTKVMTVNASSFTLFTKAQLQAIVGTDWTPTGSNCSVFVMNGDHGVTDALMTASIDASSVVRVHLNKTRNGPVRVNYLIVRFA